MKNQKYYMLDSMLFAGLVSLVFVACTPNNRANDNQISGTKSIERSVNSKDEIHANNGIGFFDIDSAKVPPKVKSSAASVFEQRILAAQSLEVIRIVDVTIESNITETRKRIKSLDSKDYDSLDKVVLESQLDRCLKASDIEAKKKCPITFDIRKSTGFLMDEGDILWTNAHAIEGLLQAKLELENLSPDDLIKNKEELRIFLFDSSGKLVFNPYEQSAYLQKLPRITEVAKMRKQFYAEDSDYVKIKLSKILGIPLKRATTRTKFGDSIFLVGYPGCTGCKVNWQGVDPLDVVDRGPELNSNGVGVKFTVGSLVDVNDVWTKFFGLSKESMQVWELNSMLFYTADSNHGSSGGPVLNSAGEVIGIHTGGLSKNINGDLKRVSRGVVVTP